MRLPVELVGDGGQQAVPGRHRRRAGVDQREAAGPVGDLGAAGREAGLPDGAACWSPAMPRIGMGPRTLGVGCAEVAARVEHLGQHGAWDAKQSQKVVVPAAFVDVEQQGSRGIGGIGRVAPAAGQPPQQPTVDGAEGKLARFSGGSGARHLVEQPGQLGGREIGIEEQARRGRYAELIPGFLQLAAGLGGAAILPDDRAMDGPAGAAVPDDRGFALIGDADAGHWLASIPATFMAARAAAQCRRPDLLRVMLDLTVSREMLSEFELAPAVHRQLRIENNRAAGCGALVKGKNEWCHGVAEFLLRRSVKTEGPAERPALSVLRRRRSRLSAARTSAVP